jgi:hypothetical protein
MVRKGLNSLIILGICTLWKHRNRCVFDGVVPNMAACLSQADEERRVWELAGAKGISFLMAHVMCGRTYARRARDVRRAGQAQ